MIGNDPSRDPLRPIGIHLGFVSHRPDKRTHQVGCVVVMSSLKDCRDPLEPHSGIDRGPGQIGALALGELLELHENQVPDFDEAVAISARRTRGTSGHALAMVIEDFRAGATRACVPHRPEIIGGGDAQDLRGRETRNLAPQVKGLVVLGKHSHQQVMGREPEFLGN